MVDKENHQKGVQFQFRKRYRKVDWKLLANVDIERIVRDLDYHALQANIMNVAFCDTKSQDFMDVDEDIIRLYRLGQYTIEYLLHCQEYLSHGTVELETKLREALRFRNEVKEKLESKQKELTDAKKESRKRKKMIAVYQSMLNSEGSNGFHRCEHCSKAFISAPFLSSHLERRHGIVQPSLLNSEDKLRIANEELNKELETLTNNHKMLQDELAQAKIVTERAVSLRDSALEQQKQVLQTHKQWEEETLRKHKEETEQVKAIYLKEASDALEEKRIAELALVEAKKGLVSNLGALRDEKQHNEVQQQQETEQLQQETEQLQQETEQLKEQLSELQAKLEEQERCFLAQIENSKKREELLRKQLVADTRLIQSVEVENASLVHIHHTPGETERTPKIVPMSTPSNRSPALSTPGKPASSIQANERFQEDAVQNIVHQPSIQQMSVRNISDASDDKEYVPFADKPYLKTQYAHSSQAIEAAREEVDSDLADRLIEITGNQDIELLSAEEYKHCKDKVDRQRMVTNSTLQIQQLECEVNEMSTRHQEPSPRFGLHPTSLPPKSPSFKTTRELLLSRPNSSKRMKTTAPNEESHDHIRASRGISHLESGSTPDLASGLVVASTPKVRSRSADNLSGKQIKPSNLEEEEEETPDSDISEIIEAIPVTHGGVKATRDGVIATRDGVIATRDGVIATRDKSRDIKVGDLESDFSEEEEEEENPFDDDSEETNSVQPTPLDKIRHPNYNPLDEDSEEEEEETVEETPSLEPEVKRRERKSYSRDSVDDSIFSFDGWSKMKNRNSMSADDAQQNIPMGHVAKMRQAVDTLNKQKRATKTIGVEIMSPEAQRKNPGSLPETADRDEDDDFTVSSLSDRDDLSPVTVGMKVDIRRSGGAI